MARSSKRSLTIPHPVRDGLQAHRDAGIIDYPSENAAWIGLARYQLICGKAHSLTEPIARMHSDDQDAIDDFLFEVASRKLSLKGQLLEALIKRVVNGDENPSSEIVNRLLPHELLRMAKDHQRGEFDFDELAG